MKEYYVENQLSQTLIQLLQEKDLHNCTDPKKLDKKY